MNKKQKELLRVINRRMGTLRKIMGEIDDLFQELKSDGKKGRQPHQKILLNRDFPISKSDKNP